MEFLKPYDNERGSVLVTGLLFVAILAIMGTAAYLSSSNELKISKNYRLAKEAYYSAEGGLEEGRARLKGSSGETYWAGDPNGGTPDPDWSAYILTPQIAAGFDYSQDAEYDSGQTNYFPVAGSYTGTSITANNIWNLKAQTTSIQFGVKIRHKREYDAEQDGHTTGAPHYIDDDGSTSGGHTTSSRGSIVYYGYEDPARPYQLVQFTTSGGTNYEPVEIIRAYGFGGNLAGDDQSMKVIEIEVVRHPGPEVTSALYSEEDVSFNGGAADINGMDAGSGTNCGGDDLPPVYTKTPSVTDPSGASSSTFNGNPAYPVQGPADYDITTLVRTYTAARDITLTSADGCLQTGIPGNDTYGSSSDFVTVYVDPSGCPGGVMGFNNITGWGLLLVDGDVAFGGTTNWNGLILVAGTTTASGGGGAGLNVEGALMSERTVTINGSIEAQYNSCYVLAAFQTHSPKIISWREVH
ncbi:MAG: pilus assembly PilX N-terminal domain-containing protein [Desulfobacterales bacterium]|nr:MAG: pilus assembly PilX N-terminal domain-containing protein [Desulfobacterales bacterium]